MKLMPMPREASWWIWLATVVMLAAGLAGNPLGFPAAIALSALQSLAFLAKEKSVAAFPVQIRVAYTALLIVCLHPAMRWLYWLPTVGTLALLLFGYCLMARVLSLLPWNRREPVTPNLLRRTFFTPPTMLNARHGLPACRCRLEAEAGTMKLGKAGPSVARVSPP